jgi:hypothetical protein
MEKKQTAVEWLAEQLVPKAMLTYDAITYNAIQQAKQMEKEQQKYFFDCGRQYQLNGEGTFTQVYNETYGGQDESK